MHALTHLLFGGLIATTASAQTEPAASGSQAPAAEHVACDAAPEGMVCIPGGPAVIGDDAHPMEAPRHTVEISTFYIDQHEVTAGDYKQCERKKACPKLPRPRSYKTFQANDRPAVPITWEMAHAYCVWAGKRLPSEAEWEKVARGGAEGRVYPWGNDEPTCNKANYVTCQPRITKPVGSYPAGAYGVFDMAGNGYEWVKDWASDCYDGKCKKPCGAKCMGRDPKGPCDGASRCKGHSKRVLKGGSWYWPADQMRGSWRRAQYPKSGIHRLSFRCASTRPTLTAWKPRYMLEDRPAPPTLQAPSAQQLSAFNAVNEDTDILNIPSCNRIGKATTSCRDPMSYLTSNEALQYVWRKGITNLGGGYVGIGADQSYSFIAQAKSEWAWLFDYDPEVVRIHYMLRAVIKQAPDRKAFRAAFTQKQAAQTVEWIKASLADNPDEVEPTVKLYKRSRIKLWKDYTRQSKAKRWVKGFGWLQTEANYQYIRTLYEQGRIRMLKGNMLTDVAMPSIAKAARALNVPIRLYYVSNAEEQWKQLPTQYRKNVAGLPFDEDTVVLRTLFTRRYHEASSKWHYILHGGLHLQEHIVRDGYANVWRFMEDRHLVGGYPKKQKEEGADAPDDKAGATEVEDDAQPRRQLDFLSHIGMPSVTTHVVAAQ